MTRSLKKPHQGKRRHGDRHAFQIDVPRAILVKALPRHEKFGVPGSPYQDVLGLDSCGGRASPHWRIQLLLMLTIKHDRKVIPLSLHEGQCRGSFPSRMHPKEEGNFEKTQKRCSLGNKSEMTPTSKKNGIGSIPFSRQTGISSVPAYFPNSLLRSVAFLTAWISALRKPCASSCSKPAIVVPPGLVTASRSLAGSSPV